MTKNIIKEFYSVLLLLSNMMFCKNNSNNARTKGLVGSIGLVCCHMGVNLKASHIHTLKNNIELFYLIMIFARKVQLTDIFFKF